MKRDTLYLFAAIAVVLTLAAAINLYAWLEPACSNETRRVIIKLAGGVGCFEFWLNRYQSLIGNMLTAAVAAATLIWLARQLGAAHRQVEAADRQAGAAAAQALRGKLPDFEADKVAMTKIGQGIAECLRLTDIHPSSEVTEMFFNRFVSRVDKSVTALTALIPLVSEIQTRSASKRLLEATTRVGRFTTDAIIAAEPIISSWHDIEAKKMRFEQVDAERMAKAFSSVRDAAKTAQQSVNDAMEVLLDDIDDTWDRIRSAEDAATRFGK